ncbi:MAG TPA: endonuclease IV, partial [Candidatus Limnocylindrales bacterium]
MLPDGRRLGAHLPLGGGMVRAVERAHEIGADAIQIFVDNPTAWRRRQEPPAEGPAFRARLGELGIGPVAVHASYLVNLAGPDEDFFGRSVAV